MNKNILAAAVLFGAVMVSACHPRCVTCPDDNDGTTIIINNTNTNTNTNQPPPAEPPPPPTTPTPTPPAPPNPPSPPNPPTTPACTYAVQETPQSFPYTGGNGGQSVSTNRADCGWTTVSNVSWITITSGTSGTGNGSFNYVVANNGGAARSGSISVAGKTVVINQAAAPATSACTYAVQETPQSVGYQGANGGFSVSASAGSCSWSATSNTFWIAITSGGSGSGNGSVSYTVAGNGGAARTGTISVAGKTVTVSQSAHP